MTLPPLTTVGIIGAGLMGSGIAQIMALAGYRVLLNDQRAEAVTKAIGDIGGHLDRMVEKGRLTKRAAEEAKARLIPVADLQPMAAAQVVIEAVLERLDVKQALFAALEEIVPETTILATNTSSLTVAAIGRALRNKNRICGLHFFNPVPLIRLAEVIPGPFTMPEVVAAVQTLVADIGKVGVLAKDGPGFLVNLGGRAYYTEALHIEHEGVATPEQIDRIMTAGLGFRMGPFQLMDLTGIDTNFPVTTFIHQGYQFDPRLKTTPLHGLMVEAGRYGRKSGQGFYDYSAGAAPAVELPASGPRRELIAVLPEAHPVFDALAQRGLVAAQDDDLPILVAPEGEDASSIAVRLGLDPARVVAVDFCTLDRGVATIMTPPVPSVVVDYVAEWLGNAGYRVERIQDSAGFVAQRILAMIVNLCAEMAQTRVGSPDDIDKAMTLGLNYPAGPLGWGDQIGVERLLAILQHMQAITGSDRYRPSLWLRRRAQLGLSLTLAAS